MRAVPRLLRPAAHRCRMTRQFETSFVDQLVTFDLQYRQILVDEVADIEIFAVGAEHGALGERADWHFGHQVDLLAVDLEQANGAGRVMEPGVLWEVRPLGIDADRKVSL